MLIISIAVLHISPGRLFCINTDVKQGKQALIIALKNNPLEDIEAVKNVHLL